jgi:tetratricopeptide (TPR) repeat protein
MRKFTGGIIMMLGLGLGPAQAQSDAKTVNDLLLQAGAAEQKNDFDGAIRAYGKIIALRPQDEAAFLDRGDNYAAKKDFPHAIADFDQAIRLKPDDARAYDYRGIANLTAGHDDAALADFSNAIALNPDYAGALEYRGMVYDDKRDLGHAIADYSAVIRLQPDDAQAFNARCWDRAYLNRDLDAALEDCNAALKLVSDRQTAAAVRDSRGFVWFRKGDLARAITDYSAALQLAPRMAETLYKRGLARNHSGDGAGGKSDIAAALRLDSHAGDDMNEIGLKP